MAWKAEEYLAHSAKGTSWSKKDHKYVKKVNGKYYYPEDMKGKGGAQAGINQKLEEAKDKFHDREWKGLFTAIGDFFKDVKEEGWEKAGENFSQKWDNRNADQVIEATGIKKDGWHDLSYNRWLEFITNGFDTGTSNAANPYAQGGHWDQVQTHYNQDHLSYHPLDPNDNSWFNSPNHNLTNHFGRKKRR